MKPGALIVFAHERTDARVVKRLRAFADLGWAVTGFTFHRPRDGKDEPPPFPNVPLGETQDRAYARRALALLRALGILWRQRALLRAADALYAINADNALLALAARAIAGRRLPLFVEIADIQPPFVARGLKGRVFRWIERRVLDRAACLVTTSPGFVREYFTPLQRCRCRVFLLENKVYPSAGLAGQRPAAPAPGPPWRVGWFGALRCQRSWDIMRRLAARFPGSVEFIVRGYPTKISREAFFREAGALPNIHYGGAYRYPDDLPAMHGGLHFVWGFDFSDTTANSRWLLPNRLYESGLFGVPMLAEKGTETGRRIEETGAGLALDGADVEEALAHLFSTRAAEIWPALQQRAAALDPAQFAGEADYAALSEMMAEATRKSPSLRSTPVEACA